MPNIKRLRKELEQKARFDTKKQKASMPRYAPKARLCYKRDKKLKPKNAQNPRKIYHARQSKKALHKPCTRLSRFLSQYNSKKSKNANFLQVSQTQVLHFLRDLSS